MAGASTEATAAAVLCFDQMGKVTNVDPPQPLHELLEHNVLT